MNSSNPKRPRLLLRRPSKRKSVEHNIWECKRFLTSKKIESLRSTLPDKRQGPWEAALKKALVLWENVESLEEDENENIRAAMWDTVCNLLKANYYLQSHFPLERIRTESSTEYAMHAVAGLKPLRSISLLPVIERLLAFHASSLHVKEPVQGRLPLHIAAATPYQPPRSEILLALIEACPSAAAETDFNDIYPLHLACQAKYPWKEGLEALYKAAPHIGELTCPCCPPELLAQLDCYDESLDVVFSRLQVDESLLS